MRTEIAVIGGGFSGTLVVAQIIKRLKSDPSSAPLTLHWIEQQSSFGTGAAYSTENPNHLMNVSADKLSAWPDQPNHFINWLKSHNSQHCEGSEEVHSKTFAPRKVYRQYLQEIAESLSQSLPGKVTLNFIRAEAKNILPGVQPKLNSDIRQSNKTQRTDPMPRVQILFDQAPPVQAHQVVLALGHLPSTSPPFLNPWSEDFVKSTSAQSVLLLGTGLTAVDMALSLDQNPHCQSITALSRHGLLPHPHLLAQGHPAPISNFPSGLLNLIHRSHSELPRSIASLMRTLRTSIREAKTQSTDWRPLVDSLRPITPDLWMNLTERSKQSFLRHAKAHWDIHRHRMAPQIDRALQDILRTGKLRVIAGRLTGKLDEIRTNPNPSQSSFFKVEIQRRNNPHRVDQLKVNTLIDCTGSSQNYEKHKTPILASLMQQGLIRPDPLQLGLDCFPNGILKDQFGNPSPFLSCIGIARTGSLWESVAIPELREQAAQLASLVLKRENPRA